MQGVLCKYCKPTDNEHIIFCKKLKKEVQSYKCQKNHCELHEFKPIVYIPIGRCDECPCSTTRHAYGAAGYSYDLLCAAKGMATIMVDIEWDSEIPPIPNWCPFYTKEIKE